MKDKSIEIVGEKCYGCGACKSKCPNNAISFVFNSEGFYYPKVNNKDCINCGICLASCPVINDVSSDNVCRCFSYTNPNRNDLINSASGGFVSFVMRHYFESEYYVCACQYDNEWNVIHSISNDIKDLRKYVSSKYVQSSTLNIFEKIKDKLITNNNVLFVGTPCQVHGLKCYLHNDFKNLLTIDLVCHGVPSNELFKSYIHYLENKEKSKIIFYDFRYKGKIGRGLSYAYKLSKNGKIKSGLLELDKYGHDFLYCKNFRKCCYDCKFANYLNRPGDITVGDFWGVDKKSVLYNVNGVSSVLVNTNKGYSFLESNVRDSLVEINLEKILSKQMNLLHPTPMPIERDLYYQGLNQNYFVNKKIKLNFKSKLKSFVPMWVIKLIKNKKI